MLIASSLSTEFLWVVSFNAFQGQTKRPVKQKPTPTVAPVCGSLIPCGVKKKTSDRTALDWLALDDQSAASERPLAPFLTAAKLIAAAKLDGPTVNLVDQRFPAVAPHERLFVFLFFFWGGGNLTKPNDAGSEGATYDQLRQALNYPSHVDDNGVDRAYRSVLDQLKAMGGGDAARVQLDVANAIFSESDLFLDYSVKVSLSLSLSSSVAVFQVVWRAVRLMPRSLVCRCAIRTTPTC